MGWPKKHEEMRIYKDRGNNGYIVVCLEDFQRGNYGAICNVYEGSCPSLCYAGVAREYIGKHWLKRMQWDELPLIWRQAIARYMDGGKRDSEPSFDPKDVRGFWRVGKQPLL